MSEQNYRNSFGKSTQDITLRDFLAPLFRRRRLVILSFCGVLLGAVLVASLWAASYYEASMQILVQEHRSDPTITPSPNSAVGAGGMITPDQISSEVALLQGNDILRSVASICGLDKPAWHPLSFLAPSDPVARKEYELERATRKLAKNLDVEAEKTADVIDVTYGHRGDPQTTGCVLNNLSRLYVEKHLQLIRPAGTSDFFAKEADKYREALQDSETRLADFGRSAGVAAPDIIRTDLAQQLANSIAAHHQSQQVISADEQRIRDEEAQLAVTPSRSATQQSSNAADILLQQLQANLLAAQLKQIQLSMKYDASYPLVQEANQEIAATKAAISSAEKTQYQNQMTDRDPTYEFLREDVARTKADLASQKATATALDHSIDSMKLQLVDLDQKAVTQLGLLRDAKANEGSYLLYVSKREQERTSDALDARSIANVSVAVPPVVPVLPAHNPVMVMLIGFFLALTTAVAVAFVAEYLDPSFRVPEDVVATLSIPVLASMPKRAA
jgi:uncharacterized protein involved in exopolysaccharide biosynthesis